MAYLNPTKLTCPNCDLVAEIRIVVGVGPGTLKGDTPYRRYHNPGPLTEQLDETGKPTGALLCPNDGTVVWTNQPGKKA